MARMLGIDYGTKRVGVALSDESGMLAQPLTTLMNDSTLLESVVELVREYSVACVVIGKSIDGAGGDNAVQGRVRSFGDALTRALSIEVVYEDERYTSLQAARQFEGIEGRGKKPQKSDASAAALILEQYLARMKEC